VEVDASYDIVGVVERSGRVVFRIWFGEAFHPRQEIADALSDIGALMEWSSTNLLALDAADQTHAENIAYYLAGQEKSGHLVYETGRS
jgi:hypothetical protein